jgi:pimeloyl-ACP methyl ester carboxylesterase
MPRIRIHDADLYYEQHGEGPPLVLIGGLGVNLTYWATTVEALSRRHSILVYDHRGAGRSDASPGPYGIEALADDLLALLDALEISQAHLLGHSMGGFVALHLAAHHPERVSRLVLYSTSAVMHWPAVRFIESIEKVWSECPEISSGALTRIFTPWNWSPKLLSDNHQVEMIVQLADQNPYKMSLEAYRAQVAACLAFNAEPLLARIRARTLVVAGEHDLIAPPQVQRHLAHALDSEPLFSDAAHNTHLENPKWFAQRVLDFTTA